MSPMVPRTSTVRRWPAYPALRLALVATVLVLAGLVAAAGPVAAAFPGDNGKITWSRVVGNGVDVFVMNADGSGQINLTNSPWIEVWAAWSPNGSRIAFSSNRDGNFEIYVMNADGSGLTRLTNNPADDSQPAWSPDGTRLAFVSLRDGNFEIYTMNADGSGQTRLTDSAGSDLEPVWAPNGRQIAFTTDRDLNFEVYWMFADGSLQTNLTNNAAADTEPSWSPDGTKLVFTSNRGGNGDVWLMNANGSGAKQLTRDPMTDLGPAWSPDGTKIVFTALRNGQDEIYVMDADGSDQTRLTNDPNSDFLADWQGLGASPSAPLPTSGLSAPAQPSRPPALSISDVANVEGRAAVFVVSLSEPSTQTVTVSYLTNDGAPQQCAPFGCATAGTDYIPRSGALVFAPGETFKVIAVPLLDDGPDPNEVFVTVLFVPINATLAKGLGAGKITNQRLTYEAAECITEFSEGFKGHGGGLVLGPDGNFWTTEQFDAKLAAFDPRTLKATEYALPPGTYPHFVMVGPDNNLWFTDLFDRIGTFNLTTKTATMFGTGITPGSVPHFILTGPDGNIYFSEQGEERIPEPGGQNRTRSNQGRIGRFDITTHEITEYSEGLPPGTRLHGLTLGPDNNIWGTLETTSQIVRFNLNTKRFDKFVDFSPNSGPHDVIVGPDGNLYVILTDAGKIGRYNLTTGEVKEFSTSLTPQDANSLVFLTVGPDPKFLWFSEFLNDRVGRLNIETGEVTEFTCGISPNSGPIGIVVGPDGNIWFSEPVLDPRTPGRMGRLVIADANRFVTAEQRYVGRLYRDLLGREADPGGLAYFSALLQQGRANRFQVAQALQTSQEAKIQAIMRVYLTLLGRPATDQELNEALGLLAQGGTIGQIEASVAGSPEYFQLRGQGTNEGFLAALYHDLLGRTPAPGDQIVYVQSVTRRPQPFGYIRLADERRAGVPTAGIPGQLGLERLAEAYPATFEQALGDFLNTNQVQVGQTTLEQLRQELEAGVPRSAVAAKLIASQERNQRTAFGLYGRFISGPPDPAAVGQYAGALGQGLPVTTVVAEVFGLPLYRGLGETGRP
jgi:Tol biopolymer transport system component/streptogramin lyase